MKRLTIAFKDTRETKEYLNVEDPEITPHFFVVRLGEGVARAYALDTIDWIETDLGDRPSVTE